jgi:hypothetical protein
MEKMFSQLPPIPTQFKHVVITMIAHIDLCGKRVEEISSPKPLLGLDEKSITEI